MNQYYLVLRDFLSKYLHVVHGVLCWADILLYLNAVLESIVGYSLYIPVVFVHCVFAHEYETYGSEQRGVLLGVDTTHSLVNGDWFQKLDYILLLRRESNSGCAIHRCTPESLRSLNIILFICIKFPSFICFGCRFLARSCFLRTSRRY